MIFRRGRSSETNQNPDLERISRSLSSSGIRSSRMRSHQTLKPSQGGEGRNVYKKEICLVSSVLSCEFCPSSSRNPVNRTNAQWISHPFLVVQLTRCVGGFHLREISSELDMSGQSVTCRFPTSAIRRN